MRKSLKWLGAFISILILLLVLAALCLVTFVNPDRFKPLITAQVMKHTGRQLTIDGNLSWSLFPYIGIKTGHVLLSNPEGFEEKIFAEIQHATFGVKLFPLLHKKIESSGIVLDGLRLNLIKNANGKNNWQFQPSLPAVTTPTLTTRTNDSPRKALFAGLAVSRIEISHAEIHWIDNQKKQFVHLEKLNLRAKNISFLKPFPLEGECNFTANNPTASGRIALTAEASLNVSQQIFSLHDIVLTLRLQLGQDTSNLQALKNMRGDIDFSVAANTVTAQGKFKIDEIKAKQIKLDNVVIPLRYQRGILELAPITADFYQGSLQSNVKINLTSVLPQIAMQSKLLNVHAGPLLQDLGNGKNKLKVVGTGNIELQLTTAGNNPAAMIKNLNGTGHVSFNQGVLQGIDIGYLIDSAYAFAKQKPLTTTNTQQTDFGNLTGNLLFHNGIVSNNDLLLDSPRFKTNGNGNIDLLNQGIDFHLQTVIQQSAMDQKNDWGNLYGLPIPIYITGSLENPSIRLDTAVLAKAVADQQIKKIKSKVEDEIKEKLNGKAGEMLQNLLDH